MNFSNIKKHHKSTLFSVAVQKPLANYLQDFLKLLFSIGELHFSAWTISIHHIKEKTQCRYYPEMTGVLI